MARQFHEHGCPLCGMEGFDFYSLVGQFAHLHTKHSWYERMSIVIAYWMPLDTYLFGRRYVPDQIRQRR